jgi:hypothetical protein
MIMGKLNLSSTFLQLSPVTIVLSKVKIFGNWWYWLLIRLDVFNRSFKLSTKLSLKTPIQFKDGAQCS